MVPEDRRGPRAKKKMIKRELVSEDRRGTRAKRLKKRAIETRRESRKESRVSEEVWCSDLVECVLYRMCSL